MSPRRLLSLSSVTGWTARITFLGCLLTMALLFTTHSEASVALRVDETRTRILLEHQPATVLLPVENLSSTPLQTRIHLELLDQTDQVGNVSGKQTLSLPIPFEIACSLCLGGKILGRLSNAEIAQRRTTEDCNAKGDVLCREMISQVVFKLPPHAQKIGIPWLETIRFVSVLTVSVLFMTFQP